MLQLKCIYSALEAFYLWIWLFCVPGLSWQDILPCVQWMSPFAVTVREDGPVEIKFFPTVPSEDCHNIQIHNIDLTLLVSIVFTMYKSYNKFSLLHNKTFQYIKEASRIYSVMNKNKDKFSLFSFIF